MEAHKFTGKPLPSPFSTRPTDIDQMPETPLRGSHHRRAQSETFFRFSDDILLDDAVADFDLSTLDLPCLSSDNNNNNNHISAAESDSSGDVKATVVKQSPGPTSSTTSSHFRSVSVDADFFDGLSIADDVSDVRPRKYHHRHNNSMDASSTANSSFDDMMMMVDVNAKKALAPDKLAELSLIDPKRAKRILANRQSAARSKERKIRYTSELERKVQTLQTEATTLSAQVTMLQRDTSGLTIENKELKLRLQAMEQQAHLRDALNETLREEVQRLKIATGQAPAANGNNFNRALQSQFSSHPQAYHFGTHQAQQSQQQQAQQLHMHPRSANLSTQNRTGQPQPSFADFN